ncbi:aminotransferase class V-fold PLP-dependent enzyme [Roseateles violae]|uniref:Aminotransferase class V-fold PLP-dependent enzyme n=1 Tax=Roseateles violae TaxID=3058042 RepID=A0ABT8DTP3_9BURK|nr:aminotransferase class V-fold PLP-dependent enzyme [Pelomonas sp. PFR6]MDN3919546.1 aminotransferase class V-fold PLP-dependent enzyme [Pelomonas sp. PFR6]
MSSNFSESQARDAVLDAQERLHEGRRNFFKVLGVGATAASGLGAALHSTPALAYGGPYAAAFGLDPGRTFMNIGTTGSTPIAVLKALAANNALIARDPTMTFNTQDMRNIIAPGFGADPFELVMSFNTTDGMSKILNGMQFNAGDEIITTNMEHPGGNSPMAITADRRGVVLKRINLPTNDAYSDATVLARFQALLTGNTKAIVFSSPPYLTGIRLPEKMLCQWAAAQGLASVIDGAHGPGMLALNFHDIGCDFYAGAGHKWQCGPGQTGILYVRNNTTPAAPTTYTKSVTIGGETRTLTLPGYTNTTALRPFWPTISGGYSMVAGSTLQGGVRDPADNVAATLMSIGNPSYPALRALQECCSMWDSWGRQNIENYIVALAQYLRSRLTAIWGSRCLATVYDANTPHHARIALTSFNPFSPGYDYNAVLSPAQATAQTAASNAAVATLRDTHAVVVRNTAVPHSLRGNPAANADPTTMSHPLRISTHLFHNMADVDNLVAKLLLVVPHP